MDAAKMKEILKTEYGICDEAEFNAAVSKSAGINLGIFTMPLRYWRTVTVTSPPASCKVCAAIRPISPLPMSNFRK